MKNSTIIKVLSLVIAATGIMVIIGWIFDIVVFKSVVPGLIEMKITTAIAFVASGVLFYCLNNYQVNVASPVSQLVATICIGFLVLIMATFVTSSLFNIPIGLETLFINENSGAVATTFAGRPSLFSMLNFILIALSAMAIVNNKRYSNLTLVLGLVVSFTGLSATLGYIYGIPVLYFDFPHLTNSMALNTAVLFMLSGCTLFLLSKKQITRLT